MDPSPTPPLRLKRVGLPKRGRDFPFALPLLRGTRSLTFERPVTLFVGENGSGKSTLLEAIAINANVVTVGAVDLAHDGTLDAVRPFAAALRMEWSARSERGLFLRAEDYFGFVQRRAREQAELRALALAAALAAEGVPDRERARRLAPYLGPAAASDRRYGGDLDERSHGESFLDFFSARLTGPGLYLLDEPEAALSPVRQLALIALVQAAVARGAQFLIATHAPMLMAIPGAAILEFSEAGITCVPFEEVEGVRTLRAFLADPAAFLRHIETLP
jgi:predicted ATPase